MTDRPHPKSNNTSTTSSSTNTSSSSSMTSAEVVSVSMANGGSTCHAVTSSEGGGHHYGLQTIGTMTMGLWHLAVNSAFKIVSARKKGEGGSANKQKALPPLPAVPPVGPGGRSRPRSLSVTGRSASFHGKTPPSPSRRRAIPMLSQLSRSQSVADVFSAAMVAARLKNPDHSFARATHCQECNQKFSLIFRRHHCRSCKRSVCAYCSNYQKLRPDSGGGGGQRPDDVADTSPSPASIIISDADNNSDVGPERTRQDDVENDSGKEGGRESGAELSLHPILHRVCRKCRTAGEGGDTLHIRSWTEEYCSLRHFFKLGRSSSTALNALTNNNPLPPKIPRLPPQCEVLAKTFIEEYKKSAKSRTLLQYTTSSFNAGLQYALKTPSQKPCSTCSKMLRFPIERKTCVMCKMTFCRNCSSRDLALTLPHDLDPGDIFHEVAQVVVKVLTRQEAEELDRLGKNSSGNATSATAPAPAPVAPFQRYRVCHVCRDSVTSSQRALAFSERLAMVQAELLDLQQQIAAVVDEQNTPSPGSGMSRWPSVRSVCNYTSAEDEIEGEAVNQRVSGKLLDRFFVVYLELERLRPETVTQGVLFKHVKQAMTSFYMTRRSVSSKRFNKRGRLPSLSGAGFSPFLSP